MEFEEQIEKTTSPRPFVFVLMPFAPEFADVYATIKLTSEVEGAYAERVDEQVYEGRISERIFNQIACADMIVADMTGRNPNVFYETGYAHALGTPTILLTQEIGEIPFDLKDWPHIEYTSPADLQPPLRKWVRYHVKNPGKPSPESAVRFYFEGSRMSSGTVVDLHPSRMVNFAVNCSEENVEGVTCNLGIVTSNNLVLFTSIDGQSRLDHAVLPGNRMMWIHDDGIHLSPGEWQPLPLLFDRNEISSEPEEVTFRLFQDLGSTDVSFNLRFREEG